MALLLFGGVLSAPSGGSTSPPTIATAGSVAGAQVKVASFSTAQWIPPTFWGVNVEGLNVFGTADTAAISHTPVRYIRFPGGGLAEGLNYTSGRITLKNGSYVQAGTSIRTFVTMCQSIGCHAILQLPAEIDQPQTAAYYVQFVVNTLGYQPAYWEIGNAPGGWTHMGVPWSRWATTTGVTPTPQNFVVLLRSYMLAIRAVDPTAKFLALGAGAGDKNYSQTWITAVVKAEGKNLSGISIHSYILGGTVSHPTDQQLFSNLHGVYSLPDQVNAVRGFIRQACPTCHQLQVFVTEINAAELSPYDTLLPTFAGTLYVGAEITQGLSLHVPNMDWFCFVCTYGGAWGQSTGHWQMQYYLFADILSHLQHKYLPANVTGPSTFYAAATYGTGGLALLLLNLNVSNSVNVALGSAGIVLGSSVSMYGWNGSALQPHESAFVLPQTLTLRPETLVLLVASPSELV